MKIGITIAVVLVLIGGAFFVFKPNFVYTSILTPLGLSTPPETQNLPNEGILEDVASSSSVALSSSSTAVLDEEEEVDLAPSGIEGKTMDAQKDLSLEKVVDVTLESSSTSSSSTSTGSVGSSSSSLGFVPMEIVPRDIDLRSVVGIYCTFKDEKGDTLLGRGSGVIVGATDGYILTNRHVVDPAYITWAYGDDSYKGYSLNGDCTISFLDDERTLEPTQKAQYPFYDISAVGYRYDFVAHVVYTPSEDDGLSQTEEQYLDFALLKRTAWNENKYSFGKDVPALVSSPLLAFSRLAEVSAIVPGFAYQAIGDNAFTTLRMLPINATIVETYYSGQGYLKNHPFVILLQNERDASQGRSGSPIFYNGYVVGLYQATTKADITHTALSETYQVASFPILSLLKKNGFSSALDATYTLDGTLW